MDNITVRRPKAMPYSWWQTLHANKDPVGECMKYIYLHEVAGKYEYVLLIEDHGITREERFEYVPGRGADRLTNWLRTVAKLPRDQAIFITNRIQNENKLYGVTNCFDLGDWLFKRAPEGTYWNEYVPGTFFWDPHKDIRQQNLPYDLKKEDILYEFIKRQCSNDDRLAEYFLKCLARKFADPFCLMGNIFVFSGLEGTGKSMLLDLIANCFGRNFATSTQQLDQQFSASQQPYAVSVVHEAVGLSTGKHALLRDRCTNEEILINVKYQIQRTYKNFTWFLLATNPSGVKNAHFLVKGHGRRYRFMTSTADNAVFVPWFKEHDMFNPSGQGFAEDVKYCLIDLCARFYDPNFTPGGEVDAKALSCPKAWGIHVEAVPYVAPGVVQGRAVSLKISEKIMHRFKLWDHAIAKGQLTDIDADDLAKYLGINELGAPRQLLPSLGRIIANNTGCGIKAVKKNNEVRYNVDWKVFSQWCSQIEHIAGFDKRTYQTWQNMNARCGDKKHRGYKSYGGKGIKVCERWHKDTPNAWQNFLNDMGIGPTGAVLGRIGDTGNYEPDNCQWEVPGDHVVDLSQT